MKSAITTWMPTFALALIFASPTTSRADMTVYAEIGIHNQGGVTRYSLAAVPFTFPSSPNASFITGLITSEDGQYKDNTNPDNSWSIGEPTFTSFNDLIASLQQQWFITLDKGLATERHYTMTLNLGSALTTDLTPPVITSPTDGSTLNSVTPTFQFTASSQFLYHADVETYHSGANSFEATTDLPAGATSWSPGVNLPANTAHIVSIYNGNIPLDGLEFSTPVDATNNELPGWLSSGQAFIEGESVFSVVPEPNTFVLTLIGLSSAGIFGVRHRKSRRSRTPCVPLDRTPVSQ